MTVEADAISRILRRLPSDGHGLAVDTAYNDDIGPTALATLRGIVATMSQELDRFGRWAEFDEPMLVTSLTDRRQHHHVYIYYRRNAFDTIRCIHRHAADGRYTFDEAKKLLRRINHDCGLAG